MLEKNNFLNHVKNGHKMIRRQSTNQTPDSCLSGGLYTLPAANDVIDSASEIVIGWDKNCLKDAFKTKIDKIDIFLYAPIQPADSLVVPGGPIFKWPGVKASQGELKTKLKPYWWVEDPHQSSNVSLSLNIIPEGNEPWDSANPMGPAWYALYNVPADGKLPQDAVRPAGITAKILSAFSSNGSLTPAGKVAAIVCPIVVVAVILGVLIRKLHIKRNNKTADWAEQMDKRMSRISVDWTSGGDGSAGPIPGTRPASYMSRPSHDMGGNMAGFGAGTRVPRQMADVTPAFASDAEMSEARPRGMSLYEDGNRTSRISFADNTRGDRISRISFANSSEAHGRGFGMHSAGHKSSASLPRLGQNRRSQLATDSYYDPDAPAVPQLDDRYRSSHDTRRESRFSDGLVYADEDDEILMSPTQNDGPTPLGASDVDRMRESLDAGRALDGSPKRKQKNDEEYDSQLRNSMLQYPALSMVSSGREESDGTDMLSAMTSERPISTVTDDDDYISHQHYQSNQGQTQLTRGAPQAFSPSTGMAPPTNATSPDEAMKQYASMRATGPSPGPNSMRSLYTPDALSGHRTQSSLAGSSLNEDDVVGYNEMIDHGHTR